LTPVAEGMCSFESLKNGAVDLYDISLMNDALSARSENERRVQAANSPRR
jgi:uncharacterized protein DUF6889